jgi:hypothetical protein
VDKATRNSIQSATQAARRLLEEHFREQLEGTFDILLDGTIPDEPGSHLSDRQRITREKLVAAVAHNRSRGLMAREAVDAYLREAAFTTLNRFVALKMLEARELVQECVSKGDESSGFKEFAALAPGLVAVEEKGYRLYIETLFDEIGQEVQVLFDRRDVASLLWPERQTLLELLGILNAPELASVWGEDETIGWVYQYFNGDDERTQMRKESQAPRNSRELAVRNQFFTPRYVVEFLVDNSLGRTWYEMMQGDTKLAGLDLLLRRPNEVFLAEGQVAPESPAGASELGSEESLLGIVHIPFRPKKDPRELRILDPACGSGHFLLYAFNLFITLYEEAWSDPRAATFIETGAQLRADYRRVEDLRRALPNLILSHNLHGVDIDPRAAQIAALALWMRAQRAYSALGVERRNRPPIRRTNIVVAEPMPGDAELLDEFASRLKPAVLGALFTRMVEEMRLAGELGSLLRIEQSIANTVRDAAAQSQQGNLFGGRGEDRDFWDRADEKIVAALSRFADSAGGSAGIRRKLFAGDAAQCVALIELLRKPFDAVVMNPPFGAGTPGSKEYIAKVYPSSRHDLFAVFVERAILDLAPSGFVACLSTEGGFFRRKLEGWRQTILGRAQVSVLAHLGGHVLDGATVRTAAYVLATTQHPVAPTYIRLVEQSGVEESLRMHVAKLFRSGGTDLLYATPQSEFEKLPYSVFGYWCSKAVRAAFAKVEAIEGQSGVVRQGLSTSEDARFIRLRWEVDSAGSGRQRWRALAKGGEYSPYHDDVHLAVLWDSDGAEVKARVCHKYPYIGENWSFVVKNSEWYFRPGLTYPRRTNKRFAPRVLPAGCAFGDKGPAILDVPGEPLALLAALNSRVFSYLIGLGVGASEAEGGAGANSYEVGLLQRMPLPTSILSDRELARIARALWENRATLDLREETAALFWSPFAPAGGTTIEQAAAAFVRLNERLAEEYIALQREVDQLVGDHYGIESSDWLEIEHFVGEVHHPAVVTAGKKLSADLAFRLVQFLVGAAVGRFDVQTLQSTNVPLSNRDPFAPLALAVNLGESGADLLVDDNGHPDDILAALRVQLGQVPQVDPGQLMEEVEESLVARGIGLRDWIASSFFALHIKHYSKSRRKAPLYWQLSTASASYSVWCFYSRMTRDTFFRVANDYVSPKVDHEEHKLRRLYQEAGPSPSSHERKAIDAQESFVAEVRAVLTEVKRIAPLWNPDLNDGVIINFAPLWRLVPQHKAWQKECKKVWDALVMGDYDWAQLAMHLWPERVVPGCQDDRSLAIAHRLEEEFWYEDEDGKKTTWKKRNVDEARIAELVAERSSAAVKAALEDLLAAPAPAGRSRSARRGKSGRKGATA